MDEQSRLQVRRFASALNLASIAIIVPAILHHYIFRMPPGEAPGSRAVLVVLLAVVWLTLAARPLATPSGRTLTFPQRAALLVGGDLAMAALMYLLHRP